MILVFGGTTEGRKTIKELEEAGSTYFYSTKTGEQDVVLHHGRRIDGALDYDAMLSFCRTHDIRLLIDAAHPFAAVLHQTVAAVAQALHIPAIRFERIFPPRNPAITWLDSYDDLADALEAEAPFLRPFDNKRPEVERTLIATTGVQSIAKLKPLEALGIRVLYRILPRPSSVALAHRQGATDNQLCFYREDESFHDFLVDHNLVAATPATAPRTALLLKESGLTGGFQEKVDTALALGMPVFALKRPATPAIFNTVNGEHGLRRMVEKLLPEFFPLHSGLTTGTCATAAAIADVLHRHLNLSPAEVPVVLPNGETIHVAVGYTDDYAYVMKDSGDDPDVTNGMEIRASVTLKTATPTDKTGKQEEKFSFVGGEGVGTFTLPGFDFPPGEPAINRSPREMIRENLEALSLQHTADGATSGKGLQHTADAAPSNDALSALQSNGAIVTIAVPGGADIARRTFNPRLGIEGGISIIGVSGIIKPFSEEAFVDSIRKCMTVAKASGTDRVVINSGAKSERYVRELYPNLPRQAFVEYGNYIGATLSMAHELQFPHVTLGVMLGKAVKLAEGQLDTHSRKGTMNKDFVAEMLRESGLTQLTDRLPQLTLARELWEIIPKEALQQFCRTVIDHCYAHCQPLLPDGELTLLLIGDDGTIHSR